ncbi:hypothetical protein YC2023_076108 [Brassica napus]
MHEISKADVNKDNKIHHERLHCGGLNELSACDPSSDLKKHTKRVTSDGRKYLVGAVKLAEANHFAKEDECHIKMLIKVRTHAILVPHRAVQTMNPTPAERRKEGSRRIILLLAPLS